MAVLEQERASAERSAADLMAELRETQRELADARQALGASEVFLFRITILISHECCPSDMTWNSSAVSCMEDLSVFGLDTKCAVVCARSA